MNKSRPHATGKFDTHEELVQNALRLRKDRKMSYQSVARNCGISKTTAEKILKLIECE